MLRLEYIQLTGMLLEVELLVQPSCMKVVVQNLTSRKPRSDTSLSLKAMKAMMDPATVKNITNDTQKDTMFQQMNYI